MDLQGSTEILSKAKYLTHRTDEEDTITNITITSILMNIPMIINMHTNTYMSSPMSINTLPNTNMFTSMSITMSTTIIINTKKTMNTNRITSIHTSISMHTKTTPGDAKMMRRNT